MWTWLNNDEHQQLNEDMVEGRQTLITVEQMIRNNHSKRLCS